MKKLYSVLLAVIIAVSIVPVVSACHFKKAKLIEESSVVTQPEEKTEIYYAKTKSGAETDAVILATMQDTMPDGNCLWVGTFQIVWNEVIDNITRRPIEFVEGTTVTAKHLNKREFKKTDISENSYYTKYGKVSPELKKEIEKGIKEKFNETSDTLHSFDFSYNPKKIFIYAMLKKDFKFLEPFDKLSEDTFGNKNSEKVKYFGIKSSSSRNLYKNVSVLFYNSDNDYAVKLNTKTNDRVILYRTDDIKKFNEYYNDIKSKSKAFDDNKYFGHYDRLKVPDISLYLKTSFRDVEGKHIKKSDFKIDKTIETIDFKMDNEGVKLKSEAAMLMLNSAGPGVTPKIRYFYFDKDFVLFLIEDGKNVPYYAMRVTDIASLNKTGKK